MSDFVVHKLMLEQLWHLAIALKHISSKHNVAQLVDNILRGIDKVAALVHFPTLDVGLDASLQACLQIQRHISLRVKFEITSNPLNVQS